MNDVTRQEFDDLEARVKRLENPTSAPTNQPKRTQRKQTVGEFLRGKEAKDGSERVICVMYMHEVIECNTSGITSSELIEKFKSARIKPVPTNFPDVLGRLAQRDLVSEAGKKGRTNKWKLTGTGEEYVDSMPKTSK